MSDFYDNIRIASRGSSKRRAAHMQEAVISMRRQQRSERSDIAIKEKGSLQSLVQKSAST